MRDHLVRIFEAGVAACHPRTVLPAYLPPAPNGRLIVLAIGKAAAAMAEVVEAHYGACAEGIAVVPHGTSGALDSIELVHAGHPLPDEASVSAAERLLALAGSAGPDDFVLVLLSGGASALACLPGDGLTLADKRVLSNKLLRCGAPIGEVNCVRRHLSRIKGGRLRADLTLAVSDVPGDRPEDIGSGPTVADPTTLDQARAVLAHYGIAAPTTGWSETPKEVPGEFRIIASARDALDAAKTNAEALGYRVDMLRECYGDAARTGAEHAERAHAAAPGTALISGGELSSAHEGNGQGGRNLTYARAAAARLKDAAGIAGLTADTDGLDGTTGAAGAFFDGSGVSPLVTGPTGTNVNDLRILLVGPRGSA
ncbi:MAG: glycerate kinase type-2 family protein [Sphingosinicella sp.]|uniref:glycerate kinase type-2 family protein n=1 Tax=Sphingosinicella sp. TaxID=1917971 RepID=UPI0040382C8F